MKTAKPRFPKKCTIRKAESVQVGYVSHYDKHGLAVMGKGRKIKGYVVTDFDGYERWFDTRRQADEWICAYESE